MEENDSVPDDIMQMIVYSQVQYEKIIELTKTQIEDRTKIALLSQKCKAYEIEAKQSEEKIAALENENEDLKHELKTPKPKTKK